MPVAPVVVWVIAVANAVLIHKLGLEDALPAVFNATGVKSPTLVAVPPGVVTVIFPVVIPDGTTAVIIFGVTLVFILDIVAATPLKLTAVAPLKLVPVISTSSPSQAVVGAKPVIVGMR